MADYIIWFKWVNLMINGNVEWKDPDTKLTMNILLNENKIKIHKNYEYLFVINEAEIEKVKINYLGILEEFKDLIENKMKEKNVRRDF